MGNGDHVMDLIIGTKMKPIDDRPDFLLLYAAHLCTQEGISPIEVNNWERMDALAPMHQRIINMSFRQLAQPYSVLGNSYSCLRVTFHGGFEPSTFQPKERKTAYEAREEEVKSFALYGEGEYLRICNEAEFKKVLKYREDLLRQKQNSIDVEYELKLVNKWINAFLCWFHANGIEAPCETQEAIESQGQNVKTHPDEKLAEIYVNCIILESTEAPSQIQLGKFSGISQPTWSKRLATGSLLRSIRDRIEQILDSHEKLIHAREIIDQKIKKEQYASQAHRTKSIDGSPELQSIVSTDENSEIFDEIDEEMTSKLSHEELIEEIGRLNPSLKVETLRTCSHEHLMKIFKRC